MAVTLCRVAMECQGGLTYSQLEKDYGKYNPLFMDKREFPLLVGDTGRVTSGLLGYFEGEDYARLYPPYSWDYLEEGSGGSAYIRFQETVSLCPEGGNKLLTLISEILCISNWESCRWGRGLIDYSYTDVKEGNFVKTCIPIYDQLSFADHIPPATVDIESKPMDILDEKFDFKPQLFFGNPMKSRVVHGQNFQEIKKAFIKEGDNLIIDFSKVAADGQDSGIPKFQFWIIPQVSTRLGVLWN